MLSTRPWTNADRLMTQKILVVDDDPQLRTLLENYLGSQGYEVAAVPDGHAMRGALAAQPFDLVILDLTVPGGMGGRDAVPFIRRIRADVLDLLQGLADKGYIKG